jgi:hypothetical protein
MKELKSSMQFVAQLRAARAKRKSDREPRVRTILRSMIAALYAGDEATYFTCFELLQKITLEMIESK